MNTLATSHATNQVVQYASQKWVKTLPKGGSFTCDHVIDAYETGIAQALELNSKLIKDKLITNVDSTFSFAKELFEYLFQQGLEPINSFMRINHWDDFTIMFLVPESQLLNKKVYDVYSHFSEYEEGRNSELFNFSISLCGFTENFNEDKVFSDGYDFKLK